MEQIYWLITVLSMSCTLIYSNPTNTEPNEWEEFNLPPDFQSLKIKTRFIGDLKTKNLQICLPGNSKWAEIRYIMKSKKHSKEERKIFLSEVNPKISQIKSLLDKEPLMFYSQLDDALFVIINVPEKLESLKCGTEDKDCPSSTSMTNACFVSLSPIQDKNKKNENAESKSTDKEDKTRYMFNLESIGLKAHYRDFKKVDDCGCY